LKIKLPKTIQLAGINIETVIDKTLISREGLAGRAIYSDQKIIIDTSIAEDSYLQSYCHEVVHYIFFILGKDNLRNDEELVDMFAHLAYQAMKSAK
jgi:hypothetical protein